MTTTQPAPRVLVAFHAHPDDEALLTAGTMAKAAAEGHRVVLVIATDGDMGLTDSVHQEDLGNTRMAEAQKSADLLGVARVHYLGYADSGLGPEMHPDPPGKVRFINADVDEAAALLVEVLKEENADVVLSYDASGGYGHRDHIKLHHVAARAAELAAPDLPHLRLAQATVPRDLLVRGMNVVTKFYKFPPDFDVAAFGRAFSAKSDITHRIVVHKYRKLKKASMQAHGSQAVGGDGDRTLGVFAKIPEPLYGLIFGREWFIDPEWRATDPKRPLSRDLFEGLPPKGSQ